MSKTSQVQKFLYEESEVRTVTINGDTWFVATDVCRILDIDTSVAVNGQWRADDKGERRLSGGLDDDEKGVHSVSTPGGTQSVWTVSEAGLYSLVLKSRKPEAKAFKRWITHDVLPSIRKTGSYSQPQSIEDLIIMQAQSMKALREEVESAKAQIAVANHRIDSLDAVNVIGDLQQRLNAMIRKLAQQEGWTFQKSWREFTGAYNTAYHTNLTACIDNYKEKHSLKDLTRPQYLSITGHLEDGIRVADKMLNREQAS